MIFFHFLLSVFYFLWMLLYLFSLFIKDLLTVFTFFSTLCLFICTKIINTNSSCLTINLLLLMYPLSSCFILQCDIWVLCPQALLSSTSAASWCLHAASRSSDLCLLSGIWTDSSLLTVKACFHPLPPRFPPPLHFLPWGVVFVCVCVCFWGNMQIIGTEIRQYYRSDRRCQAEFRFMAAFIFIYIIIIIIMFVPLTPIYSELSPRLCAPGWMLRVQTEENKKWSCVVSIWVSG